MRFKTATLGCKVNQYETEWLRTAFIEGGWEDADETSDRTDVDLVVINTCSVTAESDAKSRKLAARFAKEYPNAEIVMIGCYAASDPDRVAALPNVSEVVSDKRRLPEFLRARGLAPPTSGASRFSERSRAYVKVQDGCRVGCAYCVIPQTRPYLQSRPIDEILREASATSRAGYREIVLTGIHLGHYGLDFYPPLPDEPTDETSPPLERYLARQAAVPESDRVDLATLLRALAKERLDRMRWRIGSLEAVEVSDRLLDVFEEFADAVCPHFHLSMQSGDDDVLRAMKRRWLSAPYIEKCQEIYRRVPDAALTTDVIVGFPGETDAQFDRTVEVVRALRFSRVHVFRYSARPGTIAAAMTNQIPPEVKKERAARLIEAAREEREKFARAFLGREARVVVESVERDEKGAVVARGTTDRYYEAETLPTANATIDQGDVLRVELVGLRGDVFRCVVKEIFTSGRTFKELPTFG